MIKFNNIIWLLRKNFFITIILLILVLFFSLYVNITTINEKLVNNNKLISHSIQNIIKQHKIRLDLYSKALELNPDINSLDLKTFSAFYYVNDTGDVLSKYTKDANDPIKKFIEINEDNLGNTTYYVSELITSKDLKSSIYFAKKLENNKNDFLVAKLDLQDLLKGVNKFNTDYILVDSFGNVLYSSDANKLEELKNINDFSYSWYLSGIYQTQSNSEFFIKEAEYSGFNIRSFISIEEYFNYYFVISAFLLIIIILYFWNIYLDKQMIKKGLVEEVDYCYGLQTAENIDNFQYFDLIEGSDLYDLQKQTAFSVLEYKDIKKEYQELEQRLSSMFSKSTIPMLMIDAFTAKIFKANQSALEFYKQKITSMSKMNLYMLSKKEQNKSIIDPINLASNMQNSIKNQGFYIQTEHYVNGEDLREVKIYPFIMRSERFCYDILMILDTNMNTKGMDIIKTQYDALEKSFIISMNLVLKGSKLRIKNCSKNIDRILGLSDLSTANLNDLVHKSNRSAIAELLLKLKELKNSSFSTFSRVLEDNLYIKQGNGRYAEFKANFNISRQYSIDNSYSKGLIITAHLALLKSDTSEDDLNTKFPYMDLFKYTNTYIAIFNSNFTAVNINERLAVLLGLTGLKKLNISDIIAKNVEKIKNFVKTNNTSVLSDLVYLKGSNNLIYPCKLRYLTIKNSLGETMYCMIFYKDYDPAELDNFIGFAKNKITDIDNLVSLYCDYYFKVIGERIENNESFDNLGFDKLVLNLDNFNTLEPRTLEKIKITKELIKYVNKANRTNIINVYNNLKEYFIGEKNE